MQIIAILLSTTQLVIKRLFSNHNFSIDLINTFLNLLTSQYVAVIVRCLFLTSKLFDTVAAIVAAFATHSNGIENCNRCFLCKQQATFIGIQSFKVRSFLLHQSVHKFIVFIYYTKKKKNCLLNR